MDSVMDNATRSEYVLLAMRLPRPDSNKDSSNGEVEKTPTPAITLAMEKDKGNRDTSASTTNGADVDQRPRTALPRWKPVEAASKIVVDFRASIEYQDKKVKFAADTYDLEK